MFSKSHLMCKKAHEPLKMLCLKFHFCFLFPLLVGGGMRERGETEREGEKPDLGPEGLTGQNSAHDPYKSWPPNKPGIFTH